MIKKQKHSINKCLNDQPILRSLNTTIPYHYHLIYWLCNDYVYCKCSCVLNGIHYLRNEGLLCYTRVKQGIFVWDSNAPTQHTQFQFITAQMRTCYRYVKCTSILKSSFWELHVHCGVQMFKYIITLSFYVGLQTMDEQML